MSQSGYTPVQHYRSTTPSEEPVAGNLLPGELAINIADGDMAVYAENASGVVKRLINNPAGLKYPTADGTAGQVVQTDASGTLSFGSVQATLVSGTNIKTINSATLLGSGDVAVQATLVSGTNIKTINSTSLLGSGDLSIEGYTDADALDLFHASGSAPVYACRAWVNFNGTGTVAIRASGNVSSITDNGTGLYTVNFATAMPDANYSFGFGYSYGNNTGGSLTVRIRQAGNTASACPIAVGGGGVVEDLDVVTLQFFR